MPDIPTPETFALNEEFSAPQSTMTNQQYAAKLSLLARSLERRLAVAVGALDGYQYIQDTDGNCSARIALARIEAMKEGGE